MNEDDIANAASWLDEQPEQVAPETPDSPPTEPPQDVPSSETPEPPAGPTIVSADDALYQLDQLVTAYDELLQGQSERVQAYIRRSLEDNHAQIANTLATNPTLRNGIIESLRASAQYDTDLTDAAVVGLLNNTQVRNSLIETIKASFSQEIASSAETMLRSRTDSIRRQISEHVNQTYVNRLAELERATEPMQALLRTMFGDEIRALNRTEAQRIIDEQQARIADLTNQVNAAMQLQRNINAGLVQIPATGATRRATSDGAQTSSSPLPNVTWPTAYAETVALRGRMMVHPSIAACFQNINLMLNGAGVSAIRAKDDIRCTRAASIGKIGRYKVHGLPGWEARDPLDRLYVHIGFGLVVPLRDLFLDLPQAHSAYQADTDAWIVRHPMTNTTQAIIRECLRNAAGLHPEAPWPEFKRNFRLLSRRHFVEGSLMSMWTSMGLCMADRHLCIRVAPESAPVRIDTMVLPPNADELPTSAVLSLAFAQLAPLQEPMEEPTPEPEAQAT